MPFNTSHFANMQEKVYYFTLFLIIPTWMLLKAYYMILESKELV